ncbi:5-bromo-4-chloroindolyl phosphate hydrolysis family protein [Bacillus methanolicus]|uniref:XpaC protein n=1 Tax=Bacillus methanolicus (strain MGA3 / ATCC 53907) TaxID=796606 RepID=I3E3I6_BACMM|nr:5-bromo-4-chloroindolyl phosphate hydrolysis family protein [Bacillus methanolicus]AIE58869.1 XpaC protein [Bacillus methanolicus MGA3]EIJ81057.1 XpaC [Bacillus methanolicus MGA3]UQD50956.1 protein xpaC [Bacillus methanolicus]
MNPFLAFLVRMLIAIPTAAIVWLVSFIAFDQTFLYSTAFSLVGAILTYWIISVYMKYRFLKKHRLTRKEYLYIKKNLDEAKPKIYRLHKALVSMRHIPSLKQRIELIRITRKIYSLTKKEPKRFYKAEQFYFSHLDSALELAEKYVFLSAQPTKDRELEKSLIDTLRTLEELKHFIENDLYQILSDDIDQLHFEIDVAKHSIRKMKESQLHEEGRRLK